MCTTQDIGISRLEVATLDFLLPGTSPLSFTAMLYYNWIVGSQIKGICRCYLVYKRSYRYFHNGLRHLGFSISGYLLTSDYNQYNTNGMPVAESVELVDILHQHVIRCSQGAFTTSGIETP